MRVLVTGGAGFVGHGVVRAVVRRGWSAVVLDPGTAHPRWPGGVDHVRGSVLDVDVLRRAAAGVDLVVHVAGRWGADTAMRDLNVGGTVRVLDLGLPTVYTSSSITCGFGSIDRPGTEDDRAEDPRHPIRGTGRVYRETKLAAEGIVADAGGFIVNPDYVVGPGDVAGVVMRPLLRVARWPVIPAPRGGKCFVGVDDVGEGHLLAFERGTPGRRYLLGAENRRYADIIGVLAEALGNRPRFVRLPRRVTRRLGRLGGAVEQMQLDRFRDGSRAREELGWTPGSVDDALREAAAEVS